MQQLTKELVLRAYSLKTAEDGFIFLAEALETQDPLTIKGYQYDIVCNGSELCSGAIRNHLPNLMIKAFTLAGYRAEEVESQFSQCLPLWCAPHGGAVPGIDRIVMLLADEPNLREIVAFPMTQRMEDLLVDAPAEVKPEQLQDLHIRVVMPLAKKV